MKIKTFLVALAFLSISLMPLVYAKDAGAWQSAKAEFTKEAANNNDQKRIEVTANLANAITPDAEPEAAVLLIEQIINELARNKTGKEEEKVSIHVIDACIAGLRKMTADKAVALLIKNATAGPEWRLRFYVTKALGGINKPDVIKTLVSLIKDKESAIQMAAIEALSQLDSVEGAEPAGKLLVEKSVWEVKLTIIDYLRKIKSPDSLKYLKEASRDPNIEPRVLATLLEALEEMTAGGSDSDNSTRSVIKGEYYGVKIKSSRIVFVMDTSGSMEWATKEEPAAPPSDKVSTDTEKKEVVTGAGSDGKPVDNSTSPKIPPELKNKKKEIDSRPVKKRIDSVKKELVNAIYGLDEKVYFSIVFYNSAVSVWKPELVPATNENKMAAIVAIEKLTPGGRTNIYDALEAAYKMVGSAGMAKNEPKRVSTGSGKGSPAESVSGADTIFLLTDGNPNIGKIPDPQGIIDAVRKLNETRKIKINTIAVGVPDPDNPDPRARGDAPNTSLMSQLAQITGGTFVDKTK